MDEIENSEGVKLQAESPEQTPRQLLLSDIGQKLVLAREARDEQLSVVVRKLKLRESHLQALEAGDWDRLPDDVYALGFLRQYSRYLELDLDSEIQRIKNDQYILTRPLTFPDPPVAPSRRWAWIAGSAFIILFVAFNIMNRDTVQNLLTPAADSTAQQTEQSGSAPEEPLPASGRGATSDPENENMQEAASEPAQQTGTDSPLFETPVTGTTLETKPENLSGQLLTSENSVSASTAMQTPQESAQPSSVEEVTPALAKQTPPPPIIDLNAKQASPPNSKKTATPMSNNGIVNVHHFRFEAVTASVWLQVFLPDETGKAKGRLYKEVLLQKGHHINIRQAVESLWITSGNPAAMRIRVNGRVQADTGSLGAVGKVLRNYHFRVAQ